MPSAPVSPLYCLVGLPLWRVALTAPPVGDVEPVEGALVKGHIHVAAVPAIGIGRGAGVVVVGSGVGGRLARRRLFVHLPWLEGEGGHHLGGGVAVGLKEVVGNGLAHGDCRAAGVDDLGQVGDGVVPLDHFKGDAAVHNVGVGRHRRPVGVDGLSINEGNDTGGGIGLVALKQLEGAGHRLAAGIGVGVAHGGFDHHYLAVGGRAVLGEGGAVGLEHLGLDKLGIVLGVGGVGEGATHLGARRGSFALFPRDGTS